MMMWKGVLYSKSHGGTIGHICLPEPIIRMKHIIIVLLLNYFQNSLKVEQVLNGKYKGRSRTNEYRKDVAISKAKCSFLESDRGFETTEDLLESFRTLCPKPLFTK